MKYKYVENDNFEIDYEGKCIYFNDINNMVYYEPQIAANKTKTNNKKHLSEKQRIKIIVTNKCNLNCNYCFTKKSRGNESLETDYAIDLINKIVNKNNSLEVSFVGGGEPSLNYTAISKIVSFINDEFGKRAKYSIISNGTFDSKMRDLLQDNKFDIVISVDGDFDSVNIQQSKKIDISIYKRIIDNILFLQKTNDVLVNTVLSENTIKKDTASYICNYYKELGIENCEINLDIFFLAKKISDSKMKDLLNMIENYLIWSLKNKRNYIMPIVFNEPKFSEKIQCPSSTGEYMIDITIFPFNRIGYCYQDQNELITTSDYSINEIRKNCIQSSRKYVLELMQHKNICKTCIARQICTITNCPYNFYFFNKNYWCNNLQFLRTRILKMLIDLNSTQ